MMNLMPPGTIPENARMILNGILTRLYVQYGPTLPASADSFDMQLFVEAGVLHQYQEGTGWVAL